MIIAYHTAMHRGTFLLFLLLTFVLPSHFASAQNEGYDVFIPISKYITQGDADALSAWFDDNLEVSIVSQRSDASRAQATQIVKAFFRAYTPRNFTTTHTAGRANMKYLLGDLNAGGENFHVIIFTCFKNGSYRIQQLKIDRL